MHKNFTTSLTIIVTSLLMVAIKPNVAEANFTETCRGMTTSSIFLTGECQDEQGNWVEASINLNVHIGRDPGGRLVWQESGSFYRHCRKYRLAYDSIRNLTMLHARCTVPGSRDYITSDLNLDERIVNQNGQLIYVTP